MSNCPVVKDFFHEDTNTFSYVVSDPKTQACAIIDSVLDSGNPCPCRSLDRSAVSQS